MNAETGRNDPCPCGSGLKYKKCCLAKTRQEEQRNSAEQHARQHRHAGVRRALDWLALHHKEAVQAALDQFYAAAPEEMRELSEMEERHLIEQATEWALAEGTAKIAGRPKRLCDLALEGGLLLDPEQRQWLIRSTEGPLRLWQIRRAEPGVGLELADLLDESAETVWVRERTASQRLVRFEVIASRLISWDDGWELSTVYAIPQLETFGLLEAIERQTRRYKRAETRAKRASAVIKDYWVNLFTRPLTLPNVVHSSGERVELTTDHWQVLDPDALDRRLAAQSDVTGSREDGWARQGNPEVGESDVLLVIKPGRRPDQLEVFTPTRSLADQGRSWLEEVAGPALRYGLREIVDPTNSKMLEGLPSAPPRSSVDLPPEEKTQLMEEIYRRQYSGIADEEIPALGNRSPREALKAPEGRRLVKLWLEGVELIESKMADDDGRTPVDLGFLWEAIGLK